MKTMFDQMRNDIHKVYRANRESSELQGVPSETLDLIRDAAITHVDQLERESQADDCGCCGCGGCMTRPSGLVGDPQ